MFLTSRPRGSGSKVGARSIDPVALNTLAVTVKKLEAVAALAVPSENITL